MRDDAEVQCPWCFEWLTLWVAADDLGTMSVDCEVCCRPWTVTISRAESGGVSVDVARE